MRRKALFISAHRPDASATQAGHKIAHYNLKDLSQHYDVDTLLVLRDGQYSAESPESEDNLTTIVQLNSLCRILALGAGALTGLPPRLATRFSFSAIGRIRELMHMHSYALVWLEFSQVFWLARHVVRLAADNPKLVFSAHDVQAELVQRKSAPERWLFLRWTRRCERRLFRLADSIRVLSEKDKRLVQSYNPKGSIAVVPPKPSDFTASVRRSPASVQPHSLLFWGAMNRSENCAAVVGFIEKQLPRLLRDFPDTTLFVVGANPPRQLRRLASAHVMVTGFVEDPTPYFERASLGVVPLVQGAGVKLKTLEMLAAGLTVISTEIGSEGIESSAQLVVTPLEAIVMEISRRWKATPTHGNCVFDS